MSEYFLASCDSQERRENAAKVLDLLQSVRRTDTARFEVVQYDSENGSNLADPFSDDEADLFNQARRRKRMSKIDARPIFTAEHQRVEQIVRQQTGVLETDNPCAENLREKVVGINTKAPTISTEFTEQVRSRLANCGLNAYLRQKELETKEQDAKSKSKKRETNSPIRRPVAAPDLLDTNSLSGIWRMLDADSADNGFPITQPGYNILKDKRMEWMMNREDLTWEERDAIKHKCEEWMKKCNL